MSEGSDERPDRGGEAPVPDVGPGRESEADRAGEAPRDAAPPRDDAPREAAAEAPQGPPLERATQSSASEPAAPAIPAADARPVPSAPSPSAPTAIAGGAASAPPPATPASLEPSPPAPVAKPMPRRGWREALAESPETAIEVPASRLAAQSRRDFLLFTAGVIAAAGGSWWLLPDRTRARLLPGAGHDRLDTLAARVGLSRENRERALDRALTFDDDVAEALYSKNRRVRTYDRPAITPLRNNYDGQTPGPEMLATWKLTVGGLASGRPEVFSVERLLAELPSAEQVTRLVCVEGWSAIAWWGGVRFADLLAKFPPAPDARWAALRSGVNLDGRGRPDPYYVSIDLETARHSQTLLATHFTGRPLPLAHGAPLRLVAPMKLGLKNIKAITEITYTANEPADYWNERGYSKYDGL